MKCIPLEVNTIQNTVINLSAETPLNIEVHFGGKVYNLSHKKSKCDTLFWFEWKILAIRPGI
jgi:hypothetical protein